MPKKALEAIQAKATRRFLMGMGYNPNMPREVVYAPKQAGGMGFHRLYTTQGVRNTVQLLKHTRANTTVGKLFFIAVDWLQRWSGISSAVMESPQADIPPTSSKYLQSIREFLTKCKASIVMCKRPKPCHENDSFIMDHVMKAKISSAKINMVNKTRLHLQVETVADIANPEGTKIEPAWLNEGCKPSWSTSKWPKVGRPSKKMWCAWKNALKLLTHRDGYLRDKLGRWHELPAERRYKFAQDGTYAYEESEGVINKIQNH